MKKTVLKNVMKIEARISENMGEDFQYQKNMKKYKLSHHANQRFPAELDKIFLLSGK